MFCVGFGRIKKGKMRARENLGFFERGEKGGNTEGGELKTERGAEFWQRECTI